MVIEKFNAEKCTEYKAEIAELLTEAYSINLPALDFTIEQGLKKVYELCVYLTEGKSVFFAALEDGELSGFLWAYPRASGRENRLHLNHIVLKSTCRGRGTGSLLLSQLEEYACRLGYAGIELIASVSNAQAMKFYESNGFAGERVQFYKRLKAC